MKVISYNIEVVIIFTQILYAFSEQDIWKYCKVMKIIRFQIKFSLNAFRKHNNFWNIM